MDALRNRKTKIKSKKTNHEERNATENVANTDYENETEYIKEHLSNNINITKDVIKDTENTINRTENETLENKLFRIRFEVDLVSVTLFLLGIVTRMYRLEEPRNIV